MLKIHTIRIIESEWCVVFNKDHNLSKPLSIHYNGVDFMDKPFNQFDIHYQ